MFSVFTTSFQRIFTAGWFTSHPRCWRSWLAAQRRGSKRIEGCWRGESSVRLSCETSYSQTCCYTRYKRYILMCNMIFFYIHVEDSWGLYLLKRANLYCWKPCSGGFITIISRKFGWTRDNILLRSCPDKEMFRFMIFFVSEPWTCENLHNCFVFLNVILQENSWFR